MARGGRKGGRGRSGRPDKPYVAKSQLARRAKKASITRTQRGRRR